MKLSITSSCAHIHLFQSRMEDPNEYTYEEGNEGKVRWILDKGLGLGKKILITGFVITSAPLVLPPLVVISAIGFALSVPSGIFLASYACTEKLMNKFLPMPYYLENKGGEEAYYVDMEKEEEDERKDMQGGVESRIELEDEKERSDQIEEGKKDVDVPIEENGYEEDVGEYLDVEKEKPKEELEEKPKEKAGEKPKEKDEENTEVKSTKDKEDLSVVDESKSSKEEPVKVEGVVLNLTEVDEESGGSTVEVTTVVIEDKEGQESKDNIKEEKLAKETRTLLEEIREEGKADEQKTLQESSTSKGTGELPVSRGAEEGKDAGSSSEGVKTMPSNEAKKKKNGKKKPQQQQQQQQKVSYGEEKIWEQIEAIRGIVGYKATLQKTSMEELKALYIFIGVEPPASFKEHSDLAEVDSKLQFLMSIIGVK